MNVQPSAISPQVQRDTNHRINNFYVSLETFIFPPKAKIFI